MALKKAKKKVVKELAMKKIDETPVVEKKVETSKIPLFKYVFVVTVVFVGMIYFWWKTNSWPVVAVVNGWPISRFEIDQALYKQAGDQALEGLITQRLLDAEISRKGVVVSDADVDAKLSEIKKSLGSDENFEQLLALQGVKLEDVKKQIKVQMALEKLVESSTDSAVMQERISELLDGLRSKAKIWQIER